MKKFNLVSAIVFLFFGLSFSQGIRGVVSYADGKKPMSTDKALSSMADVYDSRDADATSCNIASTYGAHYKLIQIRNLSGSTQFIIVVNDNTGNTCHYAISAYQSTGKITPVRSIISGAVVDSTGYDFQYE